MVVKSKITLKSKFYVKMYLNFEGLHKIYNQWVLSSQNT